MLDADGLIKTESLYVHTCSRCRRAGKYTSKRTAVLEGWRGFNDNAEEHESFLLCPGCVIELDRFLAAGGHWEIARCEPECGWSFGPTFDRSAMSIAVAAHEPSCVTGGPTIESCEGPK